MKEYVIIDKRARNMEKEYFKNLGYILIEVPKSWDVYDEISCHADIFFTKICEEIVIDKNLYDLVVNSVDNQYKKILFLGSSNLQNAYPLDIAYNVCIMGKFAIHNYKYTDKKVLEIIEKNNLTKINISQGYSKCSIAVIDDNSCIVTDSTIAKLLIRNNIDVLLLDYKPNIYLLKNDKYSSMSGFIGGAMSIIDDKIIVFGDLGKIDKGNIIRNYILSKGKQIIEFKGQDVFDYGGLIKI